MPKRISKQPTDVNQAAFLMVERSTQERTPEDVPTVSKSVPKSVSKVMAMMGSKGGKIGGKRRLKTMTPEERSQVASIAANARWKKRLKP